MSRVPQLFEVQELSRVGQNLRRVQAEAGGSAEAKAEEVDAIPKATQAVSQKRAIGYVRLSREEEREGIPIAEKLEERAGQVRHLAERHGLTLVDIIREAGSGGTIADRPGMLRLLALCRRQEVTHVVTPEQARLLRGDKRDEAEVEEVFRMAGITLISHEGETDFGSEEYDPLPYEVRAMVARHELRTTIKRRKRANAERLRQNLRYSGAAPYGYRKDPDAPGGYSPTYPPYAVMEMIYEWLLAGASLQAVVDALNEEGHLSPRGSQWLRSSLRHMILNPFYAGRHSQRYRVCADRVRRHIPVDEWILAPEPGQWRHPITWEQWLEIRARYSGNHPSHFPVGLLSGRLFCACGHRMISMGPGAYTCYQKHLGASVSKPRAEEYARETIRAVVEQLPADALEAGRKPERPQAELLTDHARILRSLHKSRATLEDLLGRATYYQDLFSAVMYEATVRRERATLAALEAEEAKLAQEIARPRMDAVVPLLTLMRERGFDAFWASLDTLAKRRTAIGAVIARIEPLPKRQQHERLRGFVVTMQDWVPRGILLPKFKRT